jgi:energy-coupling factor transporter ATP-binding protein EcfA2
MIRFENVGVRFEDGGKPVLSGVDLQVDEGELVLVVGATGSGRPPCCAASTAWFRISAVAP